MDDPAPQLLHYRNRLMGIFANIVRDTESGMLSSNGFEFLSFTWDEMNDAVSEIVAIKTGRADASGGVVAAMPDMKRVSVEAVS